MIDSLGAVGAELLAVTIRMAYFFTAIGIAMKSSDRLVPEKTSKNERKGCLVALLIFIPVIAVFAILFEPAARQLDIMACKQSDDFDLCMSRD